MADSQRKTANLFDGTVRNAIINDSTGEEQSNANWRCSNFIEVSAEKVTLSWTSDSQFYQAKLGYYEADETFISTETIQGYFYSGTFTIPNNCKYIKISYSTAVSGSPVSRENIMLNTGSTALPYEPYWQHSLRKLTTATEAVENPLYSDGTAITAYTIKGNTVQNGTPTPSNPVDVNGVGERTENIAEDVINNTSKAQYVIVLKIKAELQSDTTYTLSFNAPAGLKVYTNEYLFVRVNYETTEGLNTIALTTLTIDKTDTRQYQDGYFNVLKNTNNQSISVTLTDIMVNSGSTAKPYEPYGYKIPISSGGVTTNIYLGSTQTVRAIKKRVLTGQEDWKKSSTYQGSFYCYALAENAIITQALCSHAIYTVIGQSTYVYGTFAIEGATTNKTINVFLGEASWSVDDFKAYLQAQTANGTPVTIWYVLATPQTAAVNEPLMKIGTYTDTLSNATAIPTTEGANSITVDTTVQPSEFTATWTGWHDASVKEKSSNLFDSFISGIAIDTVTGAEVPSDSGFTSDFIAVDDNSIYSYSGANNTISTCFFAYDSSKAYIGRTTNVRISSVALKTITTTQSGYQVFVNSLTGNTNPIAYIRVGHLSGTQAAVDEEQIMLNTGSTALPYEPYWK